MKYTGKDLERVLALYKSTMLSTREVAVRTGVGRQTVADWVREAGLSRGRNDSRELTPAQKQEVIRLYNEEKATPEISKLTGIHITTVKRTVRKAGIMRSVSEAGKIRKKRRSPEKELAIWAARESGATYASINSEFGIPIGSIHMVLKRVEQRRKKNKRATWKRKTYGGLENEG